MYTEKLFLMLSGFLTGLVIIIFFLDRKNIIYVAHYSFQEYLLGLIFVFPAIFFVNLIVYVVSRKNIEHFYYFTLLYLAVYFVLYYSSLDDPDLLVLARGDVAIYASLVYVPVSCIYGIFRMLRK